MLTAIETPMFRRYAASVWGDDEREAFIDWIAQNPEPRSRRRYPWRYATAQGSMEPCR
ncbi:hypothetical protein CCAE64S_02253 [Castellaniella caeni]